MSFLNPLFLVGLAAMAIPLLIHIINLRKPQTLPFSTLAFFTELKKSTIRRIKIKRYLLLFLRIAAILLLALALARPFLPSQITGGTASNAPRAIGVLIDNSPSMSQIGQQGPFIDQAREAADRLMEQARDEDRVIVQKTNGASMNARWTSPAAAQQVLSEVKVEEKGEFLADRLTTLYQQLKQAPQQQAVIYVFTDAQKSQWKDLKESAFSNTSGEGKYVGLQVMKVGRGKQKNVAVTDISLKSQMLSKDKPVSLQVDIRNYDEQPLANQFISLEINGAMVGQYQTDMPANGSKEFLFEFVPEKTGQIKGKVILEGDPVSFDNQRYFVLNVPSSRSVLLVNESPASKEFNSYLPTTLQAAEKTGSQLTYEQIRQEKLTEDDWDDKDVVVFDGVKEIQEFLFSDIQRFVQEGRGVVFFPSHNGNIPNYNRFFDLYNAGKFGGLRGEYGRFKSVAKLARIKEGHPIINELFDKKEREEIRVERPDLFFYYQYDKSSRGNSMSVLRSSIQDHLLVEHAFGDGRLMISAIGTDPGWSNFPVNPLFAPIFYRTILYAASSDKGGITSSTLGEPLNWTGSLPEPVVTLKQEQKVVKPEVQQQANGYHISYTGNKWEPGWLLLKSGTFERIIALNINKEESNFVAVKADEMDKLLGEQIRVSNYLDLNSSADLSRQIHSAGMGKEIWHWFIWAAIILLMAESFISRWYKAETVS